MHLSPSLICVLTYVCRRLGPSETQVRAEADRESESFAPLDNTPRTQTSTGATCHSCPNSARACTRADARMPMHARQCTHPHDCEPAHLLPHRCSTRDSPRTTNTVFSRTHSHSLLPIPTRATCCLTPHLLAIPRPDRSLPLAHTLGPPTFFLASTT